MSYVTVDVLQCFSGIGHGQVCVHDKLQSTWSLVVMKTIFAGVKGQEAVLPEGAGAAKDNSDRGGDTETDRYTRTSGEKDTCLVGTFYWRRIGWRRAFHTSACIPAQRKKRTGAITTTSSVPLLSSYLSHTCLPLHHLLFGYSCLLFPIPLIVVQAVSIPVKYVKVVDSHLK